MNKIALAVVCSLLAGFAAGAWFAGEEAGRSDAAQPGSSSLPANATVAERLARLEQMVGEERNARIALEDTLAMLFEDIERLEAAGGGGAV
ncbi:MAG: hypothetical protein OEZ11_07475, partial [Gammaproteobacteria bacterium]|nr:hypothetical protein [Gammaproteobacteria bacterium]